MSRTPFSRPDVDDLVSGSHVFKKRFSLNNRLRTRLPKARVKHLFGIVVVGLFLLGSQLTACGYSTVSPTGSGSPTSNTTSIPNTPGSRSGPGSTSASTSTAGPTTHPTVVPTTNPTAGPTTHPTAVPTTHPTAVPTTNPTAEPTTDPTAEPTTDPTALPTASPSSFVVSQAGVSFSGTAGVSDPKPKFQQIQLTASGLLTWKVSVTTLDGANWLSVDPTSDTMYNSGHIDIYASNLKANLPPGSYTGHLKFTPNNPTRDNTVEVSLIVGPGILSISPANGPVCGGTSVIINGFGFNGATSVLFGSTAASSFTVNSETQITATSPAGNGTVNVTVKNPSYTSPTGTNFTYDAGLPCPTAVPTPTPTVVPTPTPTAAPTPTPTAMPTPTPTDTPTPVPPTPTPTDTPTPIPSNTPTPTSIPSMTAHNRFLFRY